MKNKMEDKFSVGLFLIIASITLSLFAFVSEQKGITGYVVSENSNDILDNLLQFENINSISVLSPGYYYIDESSIVYLMEDNEKIPIAKITHIEEIQKNKRIYIDKEGRVGYVLEIVENG